MQKLQCAEATGVQTGWRDQTPRGRKSRAYARKEKNNDRQAKQRQKNPEQPWNPLNPYDSAPKNSSSLPDFLETIRKKRQVTSDVALMRQELSSDQNLPDITSTYDKKKVKKGAPKTPSPTRKGRPNHKDQPIYISDDSSSVLSSLLSSPLAPNQQTRSRDLDRSMVNISQEKNQSMVRKNNPKFKKNEGVLILIAL